jgi:hypothetical protein
MTYGDNAKMLDLFDELDATIKRLGSDDLDTHRLHKLIEMSKSDFFLLDTLHRRIKLDGGFFPE